MPNYFTLDDTQPFTSEEIDLAISVSLRLTNCLDCDTELCEFLDVYYGKDPIGHNVCSKCRKIRGL